jgi:hypothetical protein
MKFKKFDPEKDKLRFVGPEPPLVYTSHHPDSAKCGAPFRCPLCDGGLPLKRLVTWPDGTRDLLDSLTGLSPRLQNRLKRLSEHEEDN